MSRRDPPTGPWAALAALLLLGGAGCVSVVRPPPLVVRATESGEERVVSYPAYVLVHDSESFWDAHQIKDNLVGLTEWDVVRGLDLALDALTPGPQRRPTENRIEWLKDRYAHLPDCAPVRIMDGLFSALGLEKTTLLIGAPEIASAPADPLSYFVFTRVVYLTDWGQETLGEANRAAGHLAPWPGPFVPPVVTAPVNRGVDWAQSGAIAIYVHVFHRVSVGLDVALDGCEAAWGDVVWCFVRPR